MGSRARMIPTLGIKKKQKVLIWSKEGKTLFQKAEEDLEGGFSHIMMMLHCLFAWPTKVQVVQSAPRYAKKVPGSLEWGGQAEYFVCFQKLLIIFTCSLKSVGERCQQPMVSLSPAYHWMFALVAIQKFTQWLLCDNPSTAAHDGQLSAAFHSLAAVMHQHMLACCGPFFCV